MLVLVIAFALTEQLWTPVKFAIAVVRWIQALQTRLVGTVPPLDPVIQADMPLAVEVDMNNLILQSPQLSNSQLIPLIQSSSPAMVSWSTSFIAETVVNITKALALRRIPLEFNSDYDIDINIEFELPNKFIIPG